MSLEQIKSDREKKLVVLKAAGINSYPIKTGPRRAIGSVLTDFEKLADGKEKISVAGRLRALRKHGGSAFADLEDETGKIQLLFKKDELGEVYDNFSDFFDAGDFLRAEGEVFKTQKGERTMQVAAFSILAKALNQLPEKWHGLKDTEERYRRRYLDLLMNGEVKERFKKRGEILKNLRQFLANEGFLEVETPILQSLPGGALAKPFKTHLNALDMDLYLRIAPELYLKRLIVGGFEKVYELGRCFRNEGMDKSHNPDFTMLEFYWAYADEEMLMDLTEKMFEFLAPDLSIEYQGQKISLRPPFKKITMRELILGELGIDIDKVSQEEIMAELEKRDIKPEEGKACRAIDALFKIARAKITEPTFVTEHPLEMSPLAKEKIIAGLEKRYAARFQLVINGLELINAYSELNNPEEQAKRLKEQETLHEDEVRFDKDFIEALEYGMPPTAGWGLGVDRLVMLLTDAPSVREVILFPAMRER